VDQESVGLQWMSADEQGPFWICSATSFVPAKNQSSLPEKTSFHHCRRQPEPFRLVLFEHGWPPLGCAGSCFGGH